MTSIKPLEDGISGCIGDWISALTDVSEGPKKEIDFARWAE